MKLIPFFFVAKSALFKNANRTGMQEQWRHEPLIESVFRDEIARLLYDLLEN